jgi:antitoxin VapB
MEPYHDAWQSLFESLDQFSDDFMDDREQPDQQQRESAFE